MITFEEIAKKIILYNKLLEIKKIKKINKVDGSIIYEINSQIANLLTKISSGEFVGD